MFKKVVSTLLVLSLAGSLISGCGKKDDNSSKAGTESKATPAPTQQPAQYGDTGGLKLPIVDKPVTVKWMLSSDVLNLNDKPVIKEIEKRTGVKVDVQAVPSASYADKVKITLASGKLPEIMEGVPVAELNTLGSQGVFAAINTYADKLPNFKKLYMTENNWVMKSYTDDKNNIYTWPVYGLSRDVNHGFMYRKDIFDKNGIKEWTNTEEFYQALKKLKSIYPNSYPYASKMTQYIFRDWSYGWGVGGYEYFPMYFDEKAKTWKLASIQPEYKDMLDFMKKLYNEGLMDPEFMTDTQASWTAKMTSDDKAFVTFDWIGRLDMFYNQVKDKNSTYNLRYGNPVGPTGNIKTLNKILHFGTAIAKNDNTEAALKMMDYLTSPSGSELITLGIKDTQFVIGSNGKATYPGLKDVPKVDISVLSDKYGSWLESMYLKVDTRSVYFDYTEKEQEAQDKIVKAKKFEVLDPILKFTDDETSQWSELHNSIGKEATEFSAKYVMDKSYGDAQWKEWLAKADKLGAKKIADIFNAAQKRYDSAK